MTRSALVNYLYICVLKAICMQASTSYEFRRLCSATDVSLSSNFYSA